MDRGRSSLRDSGSFLSPAAETLFRVQSSELRLESESNFRNFLGGGRSRSPSPGAAMRFGKNDFNHAPSTPSKTRLLTPGARSSVESLTRSSEDNYSNGDSNAKTIMGGTKASSNSGRGRHSEDYDDDSSDHHHSHDYRDNSDTPSERSMHSRSRSSGPNNNGSLGAGSSPATALRSRPRSASKNQDRQEERYWSSSSSSSGEVACKMPGKDGVRSDHLSVGIGGSMTISSTGTKSFANFPVLTELTSLYAHHNALTSMDGFPTQPNLKELHLEHNNIRSFAGTKAQPKLEALFLHHNPICGFSFYRVMCIMAFGPSLKRIDGQVVTGREKELAKALGTKAHQCVRLGWTDIDNYTKSDGDWDRVLESLLTSKQANDREIAAGKSPSRPRSVSSTRPNSAAASATSPKLSSDQNVAFMPADIMRACSYLAFEGGLSLRTLGDLGRHLCNDSNILMEIDQWRITIRSQPAGSLLSSVLIGDILECKSARIGSDVSLSITFNQTAPGSVESTLTHLVFCTQSDKLSMILRLIRHQMSNPAKGSPARPRWQSPDKNEKKPALDISRQPDIAHVSFLVSPSADANTKKTYPRTPYGGEHIKLGGYSPSPSNEGICANALDGAFQEVAGDQSVGGDEARSSPVMMRPQSPDSPALRSSGRSSPAKITYASKSMAAKRSSRESQSPKNSNRSRSSDQQSFSNPFASAPEKDAAVNSRTSSSSGSFTPVMSVDRASAMNQEWAAPAVKISQPPTSPAPVVPPSLAAQPQQQQQSPINVAAPISIQSESDVLESFAAQIAAPPLPQQPAAANGSKFLAMFQKKSAAAPAQASPQVDPEMGVVDLDAN